MKDSGAPHGPLLGELPTAPERLCPGSWRNVSSSSCRCSRLGKTAGLKKHEKKRRRTQKQTPQKHTNTHRLLAPRARRDRFAEKRTRGSARLLQREKNFSRFHKEPSSRSYCSSCSIQTGDGGAANRSRKSPQATSQLVPITLAFSVNTMAAR